MFGPSDEQEIEFTSEQEALLQKFKAKYPSESSMWRFWVQEKLAVLVDIYGGHYPDLFSRNENLTLQYSKKLIEYCKNNGKLLPETQEKNKILEQFRLEREKKEQENIKQSKPYKKRASNKTRKEQRTNAINFFQIMQLSEQCSAPEERDGDEEKYTITQKEIAFLIEGAFPQPKLQEVRLAQQMAKLNGCVFFDIISSYDNLHLAEAYKNADPERQKIIAISVLLAFLREGSVQQIIDKILKPPFQHLVEIGYLKGMPEWIANLNAHNIEALIKQILADHFHNDRDQLSTMASEIRKELIVLSNQISQKHLLNYLREHPEITTIYGLIGQLHLPMLDSVGQNILREENYFHVQLCIDERTIDVHLFGGEHGDNHHYDKMVSVVETAGLQIPQATSLPSAKVDYQQFRRLSLLSSQQHDEEIADSDEEEIIEGSLVRHSRRERHPNHATFFTLGFFSERTGLLAGRESQQPTFPRSPSYNPVYFLSSAAK